MSVLGNIIWLIFGGFVAAIGYFAGGFLLCLTIIGMPFGLQSIRLGQAVLMPFGKKVVPNEQGSGCIRKVFDALWMVFFGWEIALAHLIGGVLLGITIIGIPLAKQHFKLIPVSLFPFGYQLVDG